MGLGQERVFKRHFAEFWLISRGELCSKNPNLSSRHTPPHSVIQNRLRL